MDKIGKGKAAEDAAAIYLAKQGHTILERNYRCPIGEIDIVSRQGEYLVFVEVRSRKGAAFGLPQETVNWNKRQRVRRLAAQYLQVKRAWQAKCRFDVIGIVYGENDEILSLEHITDAF